MEKVTQWAISSFARQFNPQKIILFGSYAYDKPTEDSDVDILVVMPFRGRNPEKATEIWMATKPRFPIDIMVRKSADLEVAKLAQKFCKSFRVTARQSLELKA